MDGIAPTNLPPMLIILIRDHLFKEILKTVGKQAVFGGFLPMVDNCSIHSAVITD